MGHEFFEDRDSFSCGVFVWFFTPSCMGWSWKPDWSNKGMTRGQTHRPGTEKLGSGGPCSLCWSSANYATAWSSESSLCKARGEDVSEGVQPRVSLSPTSTSSLLTLHPIKGVKGLGSRPLPGCSPPGGGSCSCRALHTGQSFINTCSVQRKVLPRL